MLGDAFASCSARYQQAVLSASRIAPYLANSVRELAHLSGELDMLSFEGKGSAHTCNGVTRRDFLQVGTLGAVGLSLPRYLAAKEQGAIDKKHDDRACIMIFNLGAPSQLDTFDMKPDAPSEIRGPFKPIKTASGEFELSEILPRHAKVADKFSLVRSCYHTGAAVHDAGWQMMQTGRQFTGGVNTPHAGAVVSATCAAARPTFRPLSCCPKRWAAAAAIFPTARPAASSARPMIRLP